MNDQVAAAKRWWAQALLIGGVIAVVCLPLGALGTKLGLWAFTGGFMLLAAGAVLATLASFSALLPTSYVCAKALCRSEHRF